MRLVFDIETDGLLPKLTRIHCINLINRDEPGRILSFNDGVYADGSPAPRDGTIAEGLRMLAEADVIYGQNIIKFDVPAIRKLHPDWSPKGALWDTRVVSDLIYTNLSDIDFAALAKGKLPEEFRKKGLVGSHSLEAWGYRLGTRKGDYDGAWEHFTPVMDEYARQDPVVTLSLVEKLESKCYSEDAINLEMAVAQIVFQQTVRGFAFDIKAANALTASLLKRHAEIAGQLQRVFPPWTRSKGSFIPKRDNRKLGYKAGVPVEKFEEVVFNPDSRDHIADRLMALRGWQPVQFTDNGKPKVDEAVLAALPYPEAALLNEYLTISKRLGQVAQGNQAWLTHVTKAGICNVETDGVPRIHGSVNTNGAVTGRMTHNRPNVAQTPGVDAPYGKECRSCWTASPGYVLVGCDAEGLELRCLGHFMARYDGGEYANAVVHGSKDDGTDVHSINQRAVKLNSRNSAKTFIYALIYGAGDWKLGMIVYEDFTDEQRERFLAKYTTKKQREAAIRRIGTNRRAMMMENLPALGKLIEAVKGAAARGFLIGLDGRHLHVRSGHAALNTLLQSAGALVMKQALVLLDAERVRRALDFHFVANIHDEFQMEVKDDGVSPDLVGSLAADCIRRAGDHFNFRCPLSGSYSTGRTWADTH